MSTRSKIIAGAIGLLLFAASEFFLRGQTGIKTDQTNFSYLRSKGDPSTPWTREYIMAGPAPADTTFQTQAFDAVIYLDSGDGLLLPEDALRRDRNRIWAVPSIFPRRRRDVRNWHV